MRTLLYTFNMLTDLILAWMDSNNIIMLCKRQYDVLFVFIKTLIQSFWDLSWSWSQEPFLKVWSQNQPHFDEFLSLTKRSENKGRFPDIKVNSALHFSYNIHTQTYCKHIWQENRWMKIFEVNLDCGYVRSFWGVSLFFMLYMFHICVMRCGSLFCGQGTDWRGLLGLDLVSV